MSASPPKATLLLRSSEMTRWATSGSDARSLDYFVSAGEQHGWQLETKTSSGLEIDHQFNFRWLFDWQVSR
jgi:hypothetical protein